LKQATAEIDADFVVQSRTDITIEIDPFLWLNKDYYTTIHAQDNAPNNPNSEFINDQLGVATPEIMRLAWDYGDEMQLREFMDKSERPEDILQFIIDMNGVSVKIAPVIQWDLDSRRHG
jgi:hypothetical protein